MKENRKNFLLIAFDFPPLSSGGTYRPVRFAEGLQSKGLQPVVITIDHEKFNEGRIDQDLMASLPEDLVVIRTRILPESRTSKMLDSGYFFYKDSTFYRWKKFLKPALTACIKKYDPAFIMLTVPPFSLLNPVRKIADQYQIPVVYDFRDPYSFWISSPYPGKLHFRYHRRIERKCVESAFSCLVTSEGTKRWYADIFPEFSSKFQPVFNSFDQYQANRKPTGSPENKPFTIGYFGSFYYDPLSARLMKKPWWKKKPYQYFQYLPFRQNWEYRSPWFFFRAVALLLKKNPEYAQRVRIVFTGAYPQWLREMVEAFKLQEVFVHKGFLSKQKVKQLQQECDAFLITSAKVEQGKDYFIAGKTFEYFSLGKPVISFVAEGDQKEIMKKSGLGVICDPDDPEQSASKLKKLLASPGNFLPDRVFTDQFKTSNQNEKLYQIIKPLID